MGQVQSICSSCIGGTGGNGNSPYSYEVFKKVPFFGSLSNYLRMIKGGAGAIPTGMMSKFSNMFGGSIPGFGQSGSMVPGGPQAPSSPMDFFKQLNIGNLLPIGKGGIKDSVFDLAKDDTFVRKIKKSNYSELVKSLESSGQQYTDPDFPPNDQSLGDLQSHGTDITRIRWKRVPEIMNNPVFIKDRIEPSDILQGQLGDCYFLSALSALAEQGFRIKNLFPSLEISKCGVYMARILFGGQYQEVVIDDYFPVDQNGKVFFARPAGDTEIWVMVLEKCWAKLYGSFESIIGGLPNEVLHAFSSAPVYFSMIPSDPAQQDLLWQKMLRSDQKGGLLACGTKGQDSIEQFGFVKGHAYTILGLYDKPMRLVKLRNPWGHREWKGRASDYDVDFWNQMSPTDKQMVDYEDQSRKKDKDGIFFVMWQDFLTYFSLVDICKLNDNAHYNFVPSEFENLVPQLFEFEIRNSDPSEMTIAITQPSKRGTSFKSYSRNYAALGKWDENTQSYQYVKTKSSKSFSDNFLEVENAGTGKYMLYTKYLCTQSHSSMPGVVSVYSMSPAAIQNGTSVTPDNFLSQIMYDHASRNPNKKIIEGQNDWVCSEVLLNDGGFSYFVMNVDPSSNSQFSANFQQTEYTSKRLVLQAPFKGRSMINEEVKGGKPLIVVAELQSEHFPVEITNPTPTINKMN